MYYKLSLDGLSLLTVFQKDLIYIYYMFFTFDFFEYLFILLCFYIILNNYLNSSKFLISIFNSFSFFNNMSEKNKYIFIFLIHLLIFLYLLLLLYIYIYFFLSEYFILNLDIFVNGFVLWLHHGEKEKEPYILTEEDYLFDLLKLDEDQFKDLIYFLLENLNISKDFFEVFFIFFQSFYYNKEKKLFKFKYLISIEDAELLLFIKKNKYIRKFLKKYIKEENIDRFLYFFYNIMLEKKYIPENFVPGFSKFNYISFIRCELVKMYIIKDYNLLFYKILIIFIIFIFIIFLIIYIFFKEKKKKR